MSSLFICCCNLKDRGPGRNLTSKIESREEVEDGLRLGNEHGMGKSVPTEISLAKSESESVSELISESEFLFRLELKKKYIYRLLSNEMLIIRSLYQDKYFRNFSQSVRLKSRREAYLSIAELLSSLAGLLCCELPL